jgi:hypothetical protein
MEESQEGAIAPNRPEQTCNRPSESQCSKARQFTPWGEIKGLPISLANLINLVI